MRYFAALSFLLLTACGQAGDLYLPPEQPAPVESAPPAEPAPAEQPPKPGQRK